jgi:hypothetical protein
MGGGLEQQKEREETFLVGMSSEQQTSSATTTTFLAQNFSEEATKWKLSKEMSRTLASLFILISTSYVKASEPLAVSAVPISVVLLLRYEISLATKRRGVDDGGKG